jgi:transcriptional regulator with XRE-family HTH domain
MRGIDRHVGLRAQLRREELGISRELLANRINKPVERLTSYENGWARIEPATLLQLSISLQLPLSSFFAELEPGRSCPEAGEQRRPGQSIPSARLPVATVRSTDRPATVPALGPIGKSHSTKNGTNPATPQELDHVISPLNCPSMAILAVGLWIVFILELLSNYTKAQ